MSPPWPWRRLFRRASPSPARLQEAFLRRYAGRTVIVHAGLAAAWTEELLKTPGGGGHFRFDARAPRSRPSTPIEWVVHEHILPLHLPLPLLLRVDEAAIGIRHLQRLGAACHPADIAWILDEMKRGRVHACLCADGTGLRTEPGIPVEDNAVETPYGTI